MPRTIEGIVQAHRDARALRAAGKPIWSNRIQLKDLLSDDVSPESLARTATGIAARIRAALPEAVFDVTSDDYDQFMDEIVDDLECWSAEGNAAVKEAQDILDGRLDEIYDWADANRVWID
jgi:hypothetical protein